MSYPIYAFTLEEFERQKNLIDYAGDSSAWAHFARRKGSKDKKKRKRRGSKVGTALKIGGAVAGLAGLGLAGKRYIGAGVKKAAATAPLTGDTRKQFANRMLGGARERLEGDVEATGKRLTRWKGRAQNLAENVGESARKKVKDVKDAAARRKDKAWKTKRMKFMSGMSMGKKPMGMGGMGMMRKKSMMMGKKPMSMGMKY